MSDQFVGEIRVVAFNFAPTGWAQCNGQLMPISQNTALFSLLGTYYGGDGKSTFALPNLEGSAPMHWGQGAGLSPRFIGEMSGVEYVTLIQSEMPFHTHTVYGSADDGIRPTPASRIPGRGTALYDATNTNRTDMAFQALSPAGGSLPHNNMQPYLVLNFIIALQGIFPQRPC